MTASDKVSIVGFAACTALGHSLESTLAAMGAGLNNFTQTGVPNEFGHPTVASAALPPGAPRGERLPALLSRAFEDAGRLVGRADARNVPALIGVPADLDRAEQEALGAVVRDRRWLGETTWFPYGRASTFAALASAIDLLRHASHRLVLVAGVDSLCAPAQLASLVRAGRVLSPLTEGTIPGEAAAAALLAQTRDAIVDRATSVEAEAVVIDRAALPVIRADSVSGDALATLFRRLRSAGASQVHRVIAAHSGEGYFGRSFSHAYLREVELMPEPLTVELIADRVGDVGAAAGILGLAFGTYLIVEDGVDGARRALVYSESDTGEIGAAIVAGAPTSWRRAEVR
jgi:3-oxoacyl-[acyl-carrier-protein] synthase-1